MLLWPLTGKEKKSQKGKNFRLKILSIFFFI